MVVIASYAQVICPLMAVSWYCTELPLLYIGAIIFNTVCFCVVMIAKHTSFNA